MSTLLTVEVTSNRNLAAPARSGAATSSVNRFIDQLRGIVGGTNVGSSIRFLQSQVKASGTITLATCVAGTIIEVNGVKFRAITGDADLSLGEFDTDGNDTADATSLAAAINASTDARISGVLTATSSGAVVTVTSSRPGATGNAVVIKTDGVVASGTAVCASVAAEDVLTVNGTAFTAAQQRATGTVACSSVDNGDYVTIGGDRYTAITAGETPAAMQWAVGTTNTHSAVNLAAAINDADQDLVTATSSGVTVTIRANDAGIAGNSITLTTSDVTDLAVSGTVLANGATVTNNVFDITGTDTDVATDLARAINASSTTTLSDAVWAYSKGTTVYVIANASGLGGNWVTLAETGGTLTVSGARLSGGTVASWEGAQASGSITVAVTTGNITATINGVDVVAAFDADNTTTALALVTAINTSTDALISGVVRASSTGTVVTITSVRGGVQGNAITLAVAGGTSAASGARLTGGAVPTTAVFSGDSLASGESGSSYNFSY